MLTYVITMLTCCYHWFIEVFYKVLYKIFKKIEKLEIGYIIRNWMKGTWLNKNLWNKDIKI